MDIDKDEADGGESDLAVRHVMDADTKLQFRVMPFYVTPTGDKWPASKAPRVSIQRLCKPTPLGAVFTLTRAEAVRGVSCRRCWPM